MPFTQLTTDDRRLTTVSNQRYLPFGEVRTDVGTLITQTDFGYTGQRNLAYINLLDYGARWYSSALGRFVQPDSIVPDLTDTQSWNRYSYVNNSPILYNDPTGHLPDSGDGWSIGDDLLDDDDPPPDDDVCSKTNLGEACYSGDDWGETTALDWNDGDFVDQETFDQFLRTLFYITWYEDNTGRGIPRPIGAPLNPFMYFRFHSYNAEADTPFASAVGTTDGLVEIEGYGQFMNYEINYVRYGMMAAASGATIEEMSTFSDRYNRNWNKYPDGTPQNKQQWAEFGYSYYNEMNEIYGDIFAELLSNQ